MRPFIPLLGAIALLTVSGPARAIPAFGVATDFNVFTFGDFTSSSDVEGKLAVGGKATLNNFSVASRLDSSINGTDALVVGGDLNYNGGSVAFGNIAYGGAFTGSSYNLATNGTMRHDPAAVNFLQAQADLTSLSASLANRAANGLTDLNPWGQVTLTGADATLNVFSITTAQLASLNGFTLNVPTGSTSVINVQGTAATINGFGYNMVGTDRYHTLFNFANAVTLTSASNGIEGSVLAPFANALLSGGSVNGHFITNSAVMLNGAEGHHHPFIGSLPPGGGTGTGAAVPEPGVVMLLATGLLPALPLIRRRKRG
jgi:choice-of-anchor A domain-containing protein